MLNWRRGPELWTKKKLITLNTKDEALNAQTKLTALNSMNVALNVEKVAMNARSWWMVALNAKLKKDMTTLNAKLDMRL